MKTHTVYLILGLLGLASISFDVQLFGFHIGYFVTGFSLGVLWGIVDRKRRKK